MGEEVAEDVIEETEETEIVEEEERGADPEAEVEEDVRGEEVHLTEACLEVEEDPNLDPVPESVSIAILLWSARIIHTKDHECCYTKIILQ